MSILEAATQTTIADAAFAYLEAGCSIIPVSGKRPALPSWEEFKHARSSGPRVAYWLRSGRMSGIGLVCGVVSGGLVVIDVDSQEACAEYEERFRALQQTLVITSGSGRGKHYYYRCHVMPTNAWRNGVELRSDGAYVVAPPSIHPVSHDPYRVAIAKDVMQVGSLEPVRRWILERGGGGNSTPKPTPTPSSPASVRHSSNYGRAALLDEASKIAHAKEGDGNNTLYRAALKCGSLIASGHLNQSEVERTLEAAACSLTTRDGLAATQRTIASGLRVGCGSPRSVR